jgi:hypothetical protein
MNETKEQRLARLESAGVIDRECAGCSEWYELPVNAFPFAPSHKASKFCESGKRPHCTCDACF